MSEHLIEALKQIAELDRIGIAGAIAQRALDEAERLKSEPVTTLNEVKEIFRAVRGR